MEILKEDEENAYKVKFVRSSGDSFEYDITKPSQSASDSVLSKKDLRTILPSGSDWSPLDWDSFFVLPLSKGDSEWIAVGHEVIRSHSSRGAYPELKALVYSDIKKAYEKVTSIYKKILKTENRKPKEIVGSKFIETMSFRPKAPHGIGLDILLEAIKRVNKHTHERLLVRTCILSKYHLKSIVNKSHWYNIYEYNSYKEKNKLTIEYDTYLMWCPKEVLRSLKVKEKKAVKNKLNARLVQSRRG
jgi:hypothetical protein